MAGKIQDFGEKIGGAKKDLWSNTTLMLSNFETLTDVERNNGVDTCCESEHDTHKELNNSCGTAHTS